MQSLQSQKLQNRANTMLETWLKASTSTDSVKGTTVSKREANALVAQAKTLPAGELETLKKAFLDKLNGNSFSVALDARALFAEFFKVPPESIPVTSTARSQVNSAQQVRVVNETDQRVKVATRDVKDMVKNAADLPANLKQFVGSALMNTLKAGTYKLEPEARAALTKFVASAGGGESPFSLLDAPRVAGDLGRAAGVLDGVVKQTLVNAGRQGLVNVVNAVEGNGGLDALDRSLSMGVQPMSYAAYVAAMGGSFEDILFAFLMQLGDKADKKLMEKMKEMERKEKRQAGVSQADDRIKSLLSEPDGPATGPGGGATGPQGRVDKVSTQLEALVQSVHGMVQANSDGGIKVTTAEAERLVTRLKTLPPNVQQLLAHSIATAMRRSGLGMEEEARGALIAWGKGVVGDGFNGVPEMPPAPPGEHGPLGEGLAKSDKLEDKLAAFIVDTLTSDTKTLKEKFVPFKAMRKELDAMGPSAAAQDPMQTAMQRLAQQEQASPEAAPATAKKSKGHKAKPPVTAEAAQPQGPSQAHGPDGPRPGDDMQPADSTSATQDQNEIQRLMQERTRVFEMLSNMMKAMQDMIMTSVRNMR